ncbi:MAG: hypothetical protein AAGA70_09950 [Pseudomonadota bacterium]
MKRSPAFATVFTLSALGAAAPQAETFPCAPFFLDTAPISQSFDVSVKPNVIDFGAFGPRRSLRMTQLALDHRMYFEEASMLIVYGTTTSEEEAPRHDAHLTVQRLTFDPYETRIAPASCEWAQA